jgi:exodeoxyribonuclease VII small subunit
MLRENNMPPKTSPSKKKGVDFEQSLSTLESLVSRMEQGDMTLEESLQAFETGIALTRECQNRLAAAEQQVTKLIEQQGNISLEPFSDNEGDA